MNRRSPFRLGRIAFGITLIATVCLCAVLLVPGLRQLHERRKQIAALAEERKAEEQRKLRCEREFDELRTDEGIERAAREDLRYVKDGETVFDFTPAASDSETPAPSGDGRH